MRQAMRWGLLPLLACGLAIGGPDWDEGEGGGGDAGRLPATAEIVTGTGSGVLVINGRLDGPGSLRGSVGDFQDLYLIRILDPLKFRATTLVDFDGFAEFDAQIFLFQPDGLQAFALLANQDAAPGQTDPLLLPFATDNTTAMISSPGLYYLGITGAGSVPLSSGGPMFNFETSTEVSGPDGQGAFGELIDWTEPGEFGEYRIGLQGVVSIPPEEFSCDPADVGQPFQVHDMTDVIVFLNAFNNGQALIADLAPPFGSLDFSDVMAFLLEFADGCP